MEVAKIDFQSNIEGSYLGVLIAFIELIKGKPVDVLDRIGPKELDYFCRDNNATPAFEFYTPELYEILSIGEKMAKKIKGKEQEQQIFDKDGISFLELSYAEQIEYFEEFCSKFIYQNPMFKDVYFDFEECENGILILNSQLILSDEMKVWLENKFVEVFNVKVSLQV